MDLHLASYFEKSDKKVKCLLCPHYCVLADGKQGICKTRVNQGNLLYTKAWGNLCSLSVDPIEKKPLFHFLPGTQTLSVAINGCTFRCLHCQNYSISQVEPDSNSLSWVSPEQVVEMAISKKCQSISYTYSEPVVFFEYMIETARIAKRRGVKNVMVSNGFINEEPLKELCQYLDAANIDLKSFNAEIYRKLTGGLLEPVLNTLKVIKQNDVWLEITNLIIPEWTDKLLDIQNMILWLRDNDFPKTPLHFSRFYPTYKLTELNPTSTDVVLKSVELALQSGIKYVYSGNLRSENREITFCPECGIQLIEREIFRMKVNRIENNKCFNCSEEISGLWQ